MCRPTGSSAADPLRFGTDPDPYLWLRKQIRIRIRILLFSWVTFKTSTKNYWVFYNFCLLLFEATFTSFFKDKKDIKKSQNSGTQGFSYYFCLMIEGLRAWSVLCNGSGAGKPKHIRIRLRIRNNGDFLKAKNLNYIFWCVLIFYCLVRYKNMPKLRIWFFNNKAVTAATIRTYRKTFTKNSHLVRMSLE